MAFAIIASKFNPADEPGFSGGGPADFNGKAGGLSGGGLGGGRRGGEGGGRRGGEGCREDFDPKNLSHVLRYDDNNSFIFLDMFMSFTNSFSDL